MTRIAFTGSSYASEAEAHYIGHILSELSRDDELITGACTGVDAVVAELGVALGFRVTTVLPANRKSIDPLWREHCSDWIEMPEGTDYRARNTKMVDISHRLIAFPRWPEAHGRAVRSGTWMTVRIARKAGKPILACLLSEIPLFFQPEVL